MSTIRRSDVDLPLVAITHQQAQLIGLGTDFRNRDGSRMYAQRSGSHGQELFRLGATSHCIVCGMPNIPGVLSFAHIHRRDTHLSLYGDERRVFRLCWGHHHGGYDQNWISTEELLEAEAVWFADTPKPKPHRRDIAFMQRAAAGGRKHICAWKERREVRIARFDSFSGTEISKIS